ncbi:MAG: hypothetical protein HFE28_00285 [Clostridia bacterium]|nr:hypothetical protein [Clostridia bacterium]
MRFPYKRVLVVGCGGAGKSTLARVMGERFSLPVVHLDKLWWLSGWVEREREEFDTLLQAELEKPQWVIDGNFARTFARRLQFCDAVVFLDLPAEVCLKSIYARVEEYRGKTRPDMTEGCPEQADGEFCKWVENFNLTVRGDMLAAMQSCGKDYFVFPSREEAYAWLNTFEKE